MTLVPQRSAWMWLTAIVLACAFIGWADLRRARRVVYVSGLAQPVAAAENPAEPVAGRQRQLIVPERAEPAWHWLSQTQQMLRERTWRVERVDYDNAPFGRAVRAASPYRWWLALLAAADHGLTGTPVNRAVERAALVADPLLHVLAVMVAGAFAAWRFGALAGALAALGLAFIHPVGAGFLPGVVDAHGAARLLAFAGVLAVLAGLRAPGSPRPWLAVGGVLSGFAAWLDVPLAVPVLIGTVAGGLAGSTIAAAPAELGTRDGQAWRWWGLTGALTVLLGFLVEYAPARLAEWHLETVHPLYGVAWLGAAEWLALAAQRKSGDPTSRCRETLLRAAVAGLAVGVLPFGIWWADSRGFLATDVLSVRLTGEPGGVAAEGLGALLVRGTAWKDVWALLLPVLGATPAVLLLCRRATEASVRRGITLALGLAVVTFAFAVRELALFHAFGLSLLTVAIAGAVRPAGRWPIVISFAAAAALLLPGLLRLVPPRFGGEQTVLTRMEAEELIERDLGRWLGRHAGEPRPVIYAPPHVSTTLCYYGDLRGLGSFDADNRAGFGAALSIAGARTMEEVQAAVQVRGIRYIVVPSWDPFFDDFAARYLAGNLSNLTSFLVGELRRWNLPRWLRPVAYQPPAIGGFERESVRVFEVVDEQGPAVAASRMVECLVELGLVEQAAAVLPALQRFPSDCGALAARAEVLRARQDAAGVAQVIGQLRARLAAGGDRYLPWDRRVSLAVVLAQANDLELARGQVRRCVAEATPERMRALNPGALFRLLVLAQACQQPLPAPELQALALALLPPELRSQL